MKEAGPKSAGATNRSGPVSARTRTDADPTPELPRSNKSRWVISQANGALLAPTSPGAHFSVNTSHLLPAIFFCAPNGYDIYSGELVGDPSIEDGALITLIGVDQAGVIPDWAGRFAVPEAPLWYRTAVDIVWIQHDVFGPFGNGDLQVGFNSAFPGTYYFNPELVNPDTGEVVIADEDLGRVTDNWVTVYADDTVVVQFKPHTYRLRH